MNDGYKTADICEVCKVNHAQVTSCSVFKKFMRLCWECYGKMLDEVK